MVERSVFSPCKLSWAGDCFPRIEEIPEVAAWHTRPDSHGQNHGDALSEQGGRGQVRMLGLKGLGDYSVVSEDHIVSGSYLGTGQCGGGCPRPSSLTKQFPAGGLVEVSTVHLPLVPLLSLALHKVIREKAQVITILPWLP